MAPAQRARNWLAAQVGADDSLAADAGWRTNTAPELRFYSLAMSGLALQTGAEPDVADALKRLVSRWSFEEGGAVND